MDAKFCDKCNAVIEQDGVRIRHEPWECKPINTMSSAVALDHSIIKTVHEWARMRSKDPSTKVGACVYHRQSGGMFLGYNGFPRFVPDRKDWWENRGNDPNLVFTKYDLVVHAEVNAVHKALQAGVTTSECTLYVTHFPCPRCMRDVVGPAGIRDVVYDVPTYPSLTAKLEMQTRELARMMGINLMKIKP